MSKFGLELNAGHCAEYRADFAKQHDRDQISAHKDAMSLFDRHSKGGNSADLKEWPQTHPALQHRLKMAHDLKLRNLAA